MIPVLATLTFLGLAAAGLVWAVRRDDGRRAEPKARRAGDSSFALGDAGAYGAAGPIIDGDGGCDAGDSGGGDCGGD
jgi:hypothetical protein